MISSNEEIHKKKWNNHVWKVVFILLLIGNLIVGSWASVNLDLTSITALSVIPYLLILLIINIIAILSYVFIHYHYGRYKAIIDAALISIILPLLVLIALAIHFFI